MGWARSRLGRVFLYLVLAVWAVFTLFPIYWTVITSFKSSRAVNGRVPTFSLGSTLRRR